MILSALPLLLLAYPYAIRSPEDNLDPIPPGAILFRSNRDGGDEIYLMDGDGSMPHRLTFNRFRDENPSISPDGRYVLFQSSRKTHNEAVDLFVFDLVDGSEWALTDDDVFDGEAVWSPDGQWVAYVEDMGQSSEILMVKPDGTAPFRVTRNRWGEDSPTFSPDGRFLAYESYRLEEDVYPTTGYYLPQHDLYEKGKVLQTWSMEGTRDIWISDLICLAEIDGDDIAAWENLSPEDKERNLSPEALCETRITDDLDSQIQPTFSPDGKWIAYLANRPGIRNYLYLLAVEPGADGVREKREILIDYDWDFWGDFFDQGISRDKSARHYLGVRRFRWSPTGDRILLEGTIYPLRTFWLDRASELGEVLVVHDLNNQKNTPVRFSNTIGVDHNGSWSPDGEWVVFAAQDRWFRHEIVTHHLESGFESVLTQNRVGDFDPIWLAGSLTECGFVPAPWPRVGYAPYNPDADDAKCTLQTAQLK